MRQQGSDATSTDLSARPWCCYMAARRSQEQEQERGVSRCDMLVTRLVDERNEEMHLAVEASWLSDLGPAHVDHRSGLSTNGRSSSAYTHIHNSLMAPSRRQTWRQMDLGGRSGMMISTVTVRDSEMAFVKGINELLRRGGIDNKDGRAGRDGYAMSESTKESGNTVGRCKEDGDENA